MESRIRARVIESITFYDAVVYEMATEAKIKKNTNFLIDKNT